MPTAAWHPSDQEMAASGLGTFVEFLRGTGRMPDANPGSALAWAAGRSQNFDAAMGDFMGWPPVRIAPFREKREAVVMFRDGQRQSWQYEALPAEIITCLSSADPIALAVFHVLHHNTRPDDRLLWLGDPSDPLPLGGLYVGATVILPDCPTDELAVAERAVLLRPPIEPMERG